MAIRNRTSFIIDDILTGLAAVGVIATVLFAPNVAAAFAKPLTKHLDKRDRQKELRRIIKYMRSQKLIEVDEQPDGRYVVTITDKGRTRVQKLDFENMRVKRPLVWDKKWRVVVFDVPEHYRQARDAMRSKLRSLGFKQIQRSVWVHPFPCLEEVAVVRDHYSITRYVTLFETGEVETHNDLVKLFADTLKAFG